MPPRLRDSAQPSHLSQSHGVDESDTSRPGGKFDMTAIGVISDTHGLLRPEALDLLAAADHIIHAGDIAARDIVPRLRAIAPVTAVRGNVDTEDWAAVFPEIARLTLCGRNILVLHDRQALELDPAAAGFDVVVSGHSHRPEIETIGNVLYLNPGSAGRRRFRLPVTLAHITLSDGRLRPEILALA